jgi:1,2-diacylglycerol 3-beta-galactosyltransferase
VTSQSPRKKVLILTADAGFGHKSASSALAAALEELHGEECEYVVVNGLDHPRTPAWLRDTQSDYDKIARKMPALYKFGFNLSDTAVTNRAVSNALRILMFWAMKDIVRQTQPDLIITVFPVYLSALGSFFVIDGRFIPLVCVVTDLTTIHQMWFSPDADLTVVPTETARRAALAAGLSAGKVEVIGIPVHPRIADETRSREEIRAELGWQQDIATLLVVGSKRVSRLSEILNLLNHSCLPLQLAVVAGGDEALYEELKAVEWHKPAHIYNLVQNVPTLMRAADCVMSKAGGLIVTETLAAGLPMLISDMLPGQEVGNATYVVEGGAGEMANEPAKALEVLYHWLDNDAALLRERAGKAAALGRPRAAFDIVERAWSMTLGDAKPGNIGLRRLRLERLFRIYHADPDD